MVVSSTSPPTVLSATAMGSTSWRAIRDICRYANMPNTGHRPIVLHMVAATASSSAGRLRAGHHRQTRAGFDRLRGSHTNIYTAQARFNGSRSVNNSGDSPTQMRCPGSGHKPHRSGAAGSRHRGSLGWRHQPSSEKTHSVGMRRTCGGTHGDRQLVRLRQCIFEALFMLSRGRCYEPTSRSPTSMASNLAAHASTPPFQCRSATRSATCFCCARLTTVPSMTRKGPLVPLPTHPAVAEA
jgi:hypothetical protein